MNWRGVVCGLSNGLHLDACPNRSKLADNEMRAMLSKLTWRRCVVGVGWNNTTDDLRYAESPPESVVQLEDDEAPELPKYVAWTSAQNNNWTGKRRRILASPKDEVSKSPDSGGEVQSRSSSSLQRQKSAYLYLTSQEELGTSQPRRIPSSHPAYHPTMVHIAASKGPQADPEAPLGKTLVHSGVIALQRAILCRVCRTLPVGRFLTRAGVDGGGGGWQGLSKSISRCSIRTRACGPLTGISCCSCVCRTWHW